MARIDLSQNEYMERFVGQDHIDSNDVQFWYQLLSCSFNFMRVQDPGVVDKTLEPYLVRLVLSNSQSFNIGSIVRVFLDRVMRVKSPNGQSTNPYYVFQTFNALYLIRTICKSYIENTSEEQLVKSFRAKVDPPPQVSQSPLPPMPPKHIQQPTQATLVQSQTPTIPTLINAPNEAPSQAADQIRVQQSNNGQSVQINAVQPQLNQNLTATTTSINDNLSANSPNVAVTTTTTTTTPVDELSQVSSSIAGAPYSSPIQAQQSDLTNRMVEPEKKAEITPGATMLDQFISSLINIIVDIPLNDSTYLLQVEAMNSLIVLLSVQMFSATRTHQSVIYKCLMQKQRCSIHALILTKTLLNNFVRQHPMPQEAGSIIIGLASGLWKVLTLGYGGQEESITENMPLLARQSLLLLNILINHHTTGKNPYREAIVSCQDSKFNLSDPQLALDNANNDALTTAATSKSALMSNSIKIDFHELYETICYYLHDDQVALLLYLLLQGNKIFRPYIMTTASTQLDRLMIPMLKILYSSIDKGSHHVYMILIILIILSKEKAFNAAINQLTIRGVPWYKDRVLNEISLGSLTVVIMIRTFQINTFRIKDRFMHSNLFAILANMSNFFTNLHPYACQRFVDLLERLTKRYLMATKPAGRHGQTLDILNSNNPLAKALATETHRQDLQDASAIELDSTSGYTTTTVSSDASSFQTNGHSQTTEINISVNEQQVPPTPHSTNNNNNNNNNNIVLPPMDLHGQVSPNSNSNSDHVNISIDDSKQDLELIEEVIRMALQILDNCLATQLKDNPDLIYTMLYKRIVFSSLLSSHQSFYELVINVERILTFFYNKIEASGRQMSVDEIKQLIGIFSEEIVLSEQKWDFLDNKEPNSQQVAGVRLMFQYVEDEQPEEFFIPYIWTRVYYSSGIVWNSKRIKVFNPHDL